MYMNRRTSIKLILFFGTLGVFSYSIFDWFSFNEVIDGKSFYPYKNLIADLAETIIPQTDTPGAKDAKVEDFILKMLEFCTEPRTQHKFLTGLVELGQYTINNYNQTFLKCTKADKIAILNHFEDQSKYSINIINKFNNKFLGKPFFVKLKELTAEGYCTSQLGATKGLAYDYIPSSYQACIPLKKNQKSWATK